MEEERQDMPGKAGYGTPIGDNLGITANPRASAGAGYGTPIKPLPDPKTIRESSLKDAANRNPYRDPVKVNTNPRKCDQRQGFQKETPPGAFYGVTGVPGSQILQGGQVIVGEGSTSLGTYSLGSAEAGTKVWIRVNVVGYVSDGVLLPGGDLTSASYGSGGSVPNSSLPTASSPNGSYYVQIGEYGAGNTFLPSAAGSLVVQVCPGSWIARRS